MLLDSSLSLLASRSLSSSVLLVLKMVSIFNVVSLRYFSLLFCSFILYLNICIYSDEITSFCLNICLAASLKRIGPRQKFDFIYFVL